MRFLLDESAEFRLAAWLRDRGDDVTAIAHDYPHAMADQDVLALAHRERRILITNDRDFGALIFSRRLPHAGVIYLRMPAATTQQKITRLSQVLSEYTDYLGRFLVVTERSVRVRDTRPR